MSKEMIVGSSHDAEKRFAHMNLVGVGVNHTHDISHLFGHIVFQLH